MSLSTSSKLPRHGCLVNAKSPEHGLQISDDTTYVFVPQKLQCSMGIQEFLNNSQKYLYTFQLFIDATKIITNFGSKQHYQQLFALAPNEVSISRSDNSGGACQRFKG